MALDNCVRSLEAWILAGADVATPNKRAGSGPFTRYACRACAASIALMSWSSEASFSSELWSIRVTCEWTLKIFKGWFWTHHWFVLALADQRPGKDCGCFEEDWCSIPLWSNSRDLRAWHMACGELLISSSKVGAGLPVIGPLQALVRAGDEVETAGSQVKI